MVKNAYKLIWEKKNQDDVQIEERDQKSREKNERTKQIFKDVGSILSFYLPFRPFLLYFVYLLPLIFNSCSLLK